MKASIVEMEGLLRGKCVPAKMLVKESLAEYLVRQFDSLHERAEVAERERDELRESLIAASNMQSIHREACQKAEAELARRDALALGAQQQKVVELPTPYDIGKGDRRYYDITGWHFDREELIAALDAAGVKWEVKK